MRINIIAAIAFLFQAFPIVAQDSPQFPYELKIKENYYRVTCANPDSNVCIVNKPSNSIYRILTKNISYEDHISFWVMDYGGLKIANGHKESFVSMSGNGEMYNYEIVFTVDPKETVNNANRSNKKVANSALPKDAVVDVVQATDTAKNKNKIPDVKSDKAPVSKTANPNKIIPKMTVSNTDEGEEYCNKVTSNPIVQKYVKLAKSADQNDLKYRFDTNDSLIDEWVNSKEWTGDPNKRRQQIAECAYKLKDTDYLYFFIQYKEAFHKYRKIDVSKDVPKRNVGADGTLISEPIKKDYVGWARDVLSNPKFGRVRGSAAIALSLPGGDKLIESVYPEVSSSITKEIEKSVAIRSKEKEMEAKNAIEATKLENEVKARELALKKDAKLAVSCQEMTMSDEFQDVAITYSLKPSISPDSKKYFISAGLVNFKEESNNKGVGVVLEKGSYANIRTSTKTKWFGKNEIAIGGSRVSGFGVYSGNSNIKLTNGSQVQVPDFDMICLEREITEIEAVYKIQEMYQNSAKPKL